MPFVLTIALAAFLTFQVEFILARALLPAFGGTPAVWTTSLLFFQLALLAGYAWAWRLTTLPAQPQRRLHAGLAALALLSLSWPIVTRGVPLLPSLAGDFSASPAWTVSLALAAGCGLPFVLLTATSPLVQAWAAQQPAAGPRPALRLYAVSNLGSLAGLLSYPFTVEPAFDLPTQAWLWTALFVVFLGGLALAARRAAPAATAEAAAKPVAPSTPPTLGTRALWLLLPAVASGLMLAVSNTICQDVAVVPLLWVAPLAVYLLTFILPFHDLRWVPRGAIAVSAFVAGVTALFTLLVTHAFTAPAFIAIQLALLGGLALLLHGEVARLAPPAERLAGYYLWIAAGGALGGLFVGLAAPHWFSDYWEQPILLVAAWVLVAAAWWRDRASPLREGNRWGVALLLGFVGLLGGVFATRQHGEAARIPVILAATAGGTLLGGLASWCSARLRHGLFTAVAVVLLVLSTETALVTRIKGSQRRLVARERNFFGVVRVEDEAAADGGPARRVLVHGWINHGGQALAPELRRIPGAYYGSGSGVNRSLAALRATHPGALRVGVLGLGAGSIAALAQPGDAVRFYEINPAVIRFATGPGAVFTYLADSRGTVETVEGDARRRLEEEFAAGRPGGFDLLVMDAFSGDSVPVHLLTVEAFATYARSLNPRGGIVAVNVSNRFLRLAPLLEATADQLGWAHRTLRVAPTNPLEFASEWVLLSPAPTLLAGFAPDAPATGKRPAPWTDRSSSLLSVLRPKVYASGIASAPP